MATIEELSTLYDDTKVDLTDMIARGDISKQDCRDWLEKLATIYTSTEPLISKGALMCEVFDEIVQVEYERRIGHE